MSQLKASILISFFAALATAPALAEANFAQLTLSSDPETATPTVSGNTQGLYDLTRIAQEDVMGNDCLGWATQEPDHILVLEEDFSKLELKVNSRGKDTTLILKNSSGKVLCGDDSGSNPDASIVVKGDDNETEDDEFLKAGKIEAWVGASEPNLRWNYSLSGSAK